jgi:hypothetical protein
MGKPSRQYLEALTEVDLLVFKKDAINALYDKYKIWERFGRLIIEHILQYGGKTKENYCNHT